MKVPFDVAFDRLLGHEGGYVDNPKDPGGETNWGISKRSYPDVDIKNLTRDEAKKIYFRDFWVPFGNLLHAAVMWQVFDAAVNHGIKTSIKMLQRAVGAKDDGVWGQKSQASYRNVAVFPGDVSDVLLLFLAERLQFFTDLKTFDTFGRGWCRRIVSNLRYAAEDN
jgi:lysozyme family protein